VAGEEDLEVARLAVADSVEAVGWQVVEEPQEAGRQLRRAPEMNVEEHVMHHAIERVLDCQNQIRHIARRAAEGKLFGLELFPRSAKSCRW